MKMPQHLCTSHVHSQSRKRQKLSGYRGSTSCIGTQYAQSTSPNGTGADLVWVIRAMQAGPGSVFTCAFTPPLTLKGICGVRADPAKL